MNSFDKYDYCILGAGPAGLAAAHELATNGVKNILIVDKNKIAGGLSRTETFDGVRFDIGPHRFFTKQKEVSDLWRHTLGNEFGPVDRLTRIFYNKKYFHYPLTPADLLLKLGPLELMQSFLSWMASRLKPNARVLNFEDWVIKKFGKKLYVSFFKIYTEKVWGIPCNQISQQWADQRIKGLDASTLLKRTFIPGMAGQIKTLAEQFDYPRLGAGQMYETIKEQLVAQDVRVMFNARVTRIKNTHKRIESVDLVDAEGNERNVSAEYFFSSIPLKHFFNMTQVAESDRLRESVNALRYRDHITVNLLVEGENLFPDQWIYVHDQALRLARLANYNNFSKGMVGTQGLTALSAEYFSFQGDDIWNKPDSLLIESATKEIEDIGLLKGTRVVKSWVIRETEAYPMHYIGFEKNYENLKKRLSEFENLSVIGRAGLHKYNNMDHSIFSGMLAARNRLNLPGTPHDLWRINIDAVYSEAEKRTNGDANDA